MTEREAFESWLQNEMHGKLNGNLGEWWAFQAACRWQRMQDVRICDEVSAMMETRPCAEYAAGGKGAASNCANFITLGHVIKD